MRIFSRGPRKNDRVVLTHDVSTLISHARDRVMRGQTMPGVFEVDSRIGAGQAIDDIILINDYSLPDEWAGQVRFLPLR